MRKVIFAINLTLDGCCDHTKVNGYDDIHEYFAALIEEAGLLVYGRKTYELMVPFWPDVAKAQSMDEASNEFARIFDSKDKLVFSQTLDKVEDRNSKIAREDPKDEILKLKQGEGKPILLGGVSLSSYLIELGLVDEYYLVFQPVIVGEGRRFLDGVSLQQKFELELVGSKILKSGCVALHYRKQ